MAITKKDVAKLYIAMFGRAPEGEGLNYWYNLATENNWDMATLADNMFYAASQLFPEYADVRKLVETIYQNVLGKSPEDDPEGINYWVQQIQSGQTTPGKVAADIIYTAETQYPDHPATKTLENRAEVAVQVAETIPTADIDGDGQIEDTELQQFKQIIQTVTDDPNTKEIALQIAQQIAQNITNKVFELTVGSDSIIGTQQNDLFKAPIVLNQINGTLTDTLSSTDSINGNAGYDKLVAQLQGETYAPIISSVEEIQITAFGTTTFDMVNTTGVEKIINNNSVTSVTFKNIQDEAELYIQNSKKQFTNFILDNSIFTTLSDTLKLHVSNVDNGSSKSIGIDGNDIETLEIYSEGSKSKVNLDDAHGDGENSALDYTQKLVIKGDASLTLSDDTNALNRLKYVDASEFTGDTLSLNLTNNSTAGLNVKGSAKDDTLNLGTSLDKDDVIDLGDGNDTLKVSLNNDITTPPVINNTETLVVYSLNSADRTLNLDKMPALQNIVIGDNGQTPDNNILTLNKVHTTTPNVTFNAGGVTSSTPISSLTLTLKDGTGTNDTLNIFVTNKDSNGNLINNTKDAQITISSITANKIENINIKTDPLHPDDPDVPGLSGGLVIATLTDDKLYKLTLESDTYIEITNPLSSTLNTVDASKANGGVSIDITNSEDADNPTASNKKVTVTTGAGADTVKFDASNSASYVIKTGDGKDTVTYAASSDAAAADNYSVVIDVGAGDDKVDVSKQDDADDSNDGTITITLGEGKDVVVLNGDLSFATDSDGELIDSNLDTTITDFDIENDKIDLDANGSLFGDPATTKVPSSVVKFINISDPTGDTTLEDINPASIGGLNVLYGRNAADLTADNIEALIDSEISGGNLANNGDTVYFMVTDGTDAALVKAIDNDKTDGNGVDVIQIIAIFEGLDDNALKQMTADNFVDFLAA